MNTATRRRWRITDTARFAWIPCLLLALPVLADEPPPPLLRAGPLTSRGVSIVPDASLIPGPGSCEPSVNVNFVQPTQTLVAAFYFPWHTPANSCPGSADWCTCFYSKPGNPEPHLGFYASDSESVVSAHLDQLQSASVNVVAVEWTGFNNLLDDNLRLRIVPGLAGRPLQFVLLYDAAIRLGLNADGIDFNDSTTRTRFSSDLGAFAAAAASDPYFKNPKYLKFDNKPVIYIYVTRAITGSEANITAAFAQAQAAAQAQGFAGLYIVADQLFWKFGGPTVGVTDTLRWMQASAVSSFGPVADSVLPGTSGPPIRVYADKMADEIYRPARDELRWAHMRVDINPGVFVQFDNTGSQPGAPCAFGSDARTVHLQNGDDWTHMIRNAGIKQQWVARETTIDADCSVSHDENPRRSIIWIYSFNEWGEGTGLERLKPRTPAFPYGFDSDLLSRTSAAVGGGGGTTPPQAPGLGGPDGSVEGLRPVFVWDEVPAGAQYNIRVRDAANTLIVDATTTGTTFQPDSPLAANVAHTWRVRAKTAASAFGEFSSPQPFTPKPIFTEPPGIAQLVGPSGCVSTVRPTLSWQAATNARDYKLLITEDAIGYDVYYGDVDALSFTPSGNMLTPSGELEAGKQYRFRVKARNSIGEVWTPYFLYFTPLCNGKTLAVQDAALAEGDTGTANLTVPVTLSGPVAQTVTVSYATSDVTATASSDYQAVSGVLTFPAGTTTRSILVPIVGDRADEPEETFKVTLGNAANAGIADAEGYQTILDDDEPPNVPTDPQPASGSVWTSLVVQLSWTGGDPDPGDTVTYDVYFGAVPNPPLVASSLATTSYRAPLLRLGTTYYWRVLARDQSGNLTTGDVWTLVVPAQPHCTTISAVPHTIVDSGRYCLDRDIETNLTSGAAISIEADDVTLDLMGFTLRGVGAGTAVGIGSPSGDNVVVRNGAVAGFARGVSLSSPAAKGHLVERMNVSDSSQAGIWVAGAGSIVRRNAVASILAPPASGAAAYGIAVEGAASRVLDNDVMEVLGNGAGRGAGIFAAGLRSLIQGNRVGLSGTATANTTGVAAMAALVVGNRLTRLEKGLDFGEERVVSRYRDNVTVGCSTPYIGGVDLGNNH